MAQPEWRAIPDRIKRAREDAGLTQPDLAARVGLRHPQSISNYERGLNDVPPRRMRLIAEATGKPLAFFLDSNAQDAEFAANPDLLRLITESLQTSERIRAAARGAAAAASRRAGICRKLPVRAGRRGAVVRRRAGKPAWEEAGLGCVLF